MGRKIEMKKIEDVTKCQVTFSKRRSSMMKKANEIAVCCDVDVAFVAFSPSGRVSKFCNQKRIEEVLNRYVSLPPDKRFIHLSNVQGKMEKLKQLRHINGDHSKLHYLEKQIENLELQIKKSGLELQILETDLRDFEIIPGQEPSLHQLSWCERNLNQSLEVVLARKDALAELEIQSKSQSQSQSQSHVAFQAPLIQNLPIINPNPISNQMIMQLDPWISPFSARVRENIFQNMIGQANPPTNQLPNPIVMPNVPIQEPNPSYISQQQPPMMDQPLHILNDPNIVNTLKQSVMMDEALFNFNDQNNVINASSHAVFSDAIQMSTQTPMLTINDTTPSSNKTNTAAPNLNKGAVYEVGSGSQSKNSNAIPSQVSQDVEQVNNTPIFNGNNNTSENNNVVVNGEVYTINVDEVEANTPHVTAAGNHVFENEWTANLSKSAWEWEAMFLDEHFNFQHMP